MADLSDDQLDQLAECLPDCIEIYGPYRPRHAPECRHDDLALLVAEVRRLRRLERIKDRVGLDLDAQLSEVMAERDRLRDGIRRYLACDGSAGRFDALELADVRDELRALLDGQEDDRDPDDGMTDDEAADAFLAALDNSCPLCGGGPVVDGVCRDDHHHDDQGVESDG